MVGLQTALGAFKRLCVFHWLHLLPSKQINEERKWQHIIMRRSRLFKCPRAKLVSTSLLFLLLFAYACINTTRIRNKNSFAALRFCPFLLSRVVCAITMNICFMWISFRSPIALVHTDTFLRTLRILTLHAITAVALVLPFSHVQNEGAEITTAVLALHNHSVFVSSPVTSMKYQ